MNQNDVYAYHASRKAFARKIAQHYGLAREITEDEVKAEIANLVRRARSGSMMDMDYALAAKLNLQLPPFVFP